jgi:ubiquinone/menaquinone biosynthesis C-methylase UbiE
MCELMVGLPEVHTLDVDDQVRDAERCVESGTPPERSVVPSVEENEAQWNRNYDWEAYGDEWSSHWGGVETQWQATLLPRIWPFVPTGTICELAPGYGRWSQFLIGLCDRYVGVDLASRCVDACRERFASSEHASFEVNDGTSLPMLGHESVDFMFSFDSLVHAEADVIGRYLGELARVLAPNGIAWLHHSNLGEFRSEIRRMRHAEAVARRVTVLQSALQKRGLIGWPHWRAESMTAARFVEMTFDAGLSCVGQEVVNWGGSRLIDCISLVARPGSVWDRPLEVRRNPNFMDEGASAQSIAAVFTSLMGRGSG